jgi:hypothetical protein
MLSVIRFFYRFLLTLSATFWMVSVYGVQNGWLTKFCGQIGAMAIFIVGPLVLSAIPLFLSRFLEKSSIKSCAECRLADGEFITIYLGYFFTALSVEKDATTTFLFLYGVVFVFTWLSQTMYFNPFYLLFGYHFYHVMTEEKTEIFVIMHGKVIRNAQNMYTERARAINATTYLKK